MARVGPMPQPNDASGGKRSAKAGGGRSKGITMEDLKKQTALRLAKEHKSSDAGGLEPPSNPLQGQKMATRPLLPPPTPPQTRGPYEYGAPLGTALGGGFQGYPSHPPAPPTPGYYNPPHIGMYPHSQAPYHVPYPPAAAGYGVYSVTTSAPPPPSAVMLPPPPVPKQPVQHRGPTPQPPTPPMVNQAQAAPHTSAASHSGPQSGYTSTPSQLTLATAGGLVKSSEASNPTRSGGKNGIAPAKSKLPHGLTVHELKEMTKARLQAESSDKPEEEGDATGTPRDVFVPRPLSAGTAGSTAGSTAVAGRSVQPSPLTAPGAPSYRAVSQRSETWESASVASYNSAAGMSDTFGHESGSDVGSYAGNRLRSFTYPAVQAMDQDNLSVNLNGSRDSFSNPPSAQASPRGPRGGFAVSTFDAAVGVNRRRAVTLSPNTGSILEDRPHHFGSTSRSDNLTIPHFAGSGEAHTALTRQRDYSPVFEQLGLGLDNSFLGSQSTGSAGSGSFLGDGFRRSTGTAITTLPSMSLVDATAPERHSLNDLPTTKALGASLRDGSASETRVPAPPPGFTTPERLLHNGSSRTAFSRVGSVEIISETFVAQKERSSQWELGNGGRPHLASMENLANDMGSLLNLSGASTDRPDRGRANTYTYGTGSNSGPVTSSFFASLPDDGQKDPFRHY